MSRAKPVILSRKVFETQRAATDFFRGMLHRYKDGDRIGAEDSSYLLELLQRHPEDKIRSGVEYFYRDRNPEQPTSGFHLRRVSGDWTDFSYITCIKAKAPTPRGYFYRACRVSVSSYLAAAKARLFLDGPVYCAKSGNLATKEGSEYRHTSPSFSELVDRFITEFKIEVSMTLFDDDRDRQYSVKFLDPELEGLFIHFHQREARLSVFEI